MVNCQLPIVKLRQSAVVLIMGVALFLMMGCRVENVPVMAPTEEMISESTSTPTVIIETKTVQATLTSPSVSAPPPTAAQPIRYLALGDSYTIGEKVAESERWPVQLVQQLRDAGVAIEDAEIIARTGWTTNELAAGIVAANPEGPYDLVTLLIGVNDQYRGWNEETYRMRFAELLQTAVKFANSDPSHVIVVSIPDWGVTPFANGRDREAIAAEIDAFNAINREETARQGAHYVDITQGSRRASEDGALIAFDGLHPSGKMYAEWADAVAPIVRQLLK